MNENIKPTCTSWVELKREIWLIRMQRRNWQRVHMRARLHKWVKSGKAVLTIRVTSLLMILLVGREQSYLKCNTVPEYRSLSNNLSAIWHLQGLYATMSRQQLIIQSARQLAVVPLAPCLGLSPLRKRLSKWDPIQKSPYLLTSISVRSTEKSWKRSIPNGRRLKWWNVSVLPGPTWREMRRPNTSSKRRMIREGTRRRYKICKGGRRSMGRYPGSGSKKMIYRRRKMKKRRSWNILLSSR